MALTPEDKQWISEQLGRFASHQDLERFATRDDLERFAARLELCATREDLERMETKLLTAFHEWSQPINVRMRSHAGDICALQIDLEALEDRVTKLEEGKS